MALKLEEHVVYVESMKADMIPYDIVKKYVKEVVEEQKPAIDDINKNVTAAEKEISSALSDLTKELKNLSKI